MNAGNMKDAVDGLVKVYGPFAFGIVSLLIIWLLIIKPELENKQLDFDTQKVLIEQLSQETRQSQEIARTMRDTALILERIVNRLEQ